MGKRPKTAKPTPSAFMDRLEENEEMMAEMAAFHVTCEQFEIEPEVGWDLMEKAGDRD